MKKQLAAVNLLYPMPIALIGAVCDGRVNYLPIAHLGIIDFNHLSASLGRVHFTNQGIRETGVFSLNLPTAELVEKVDYCGLVSGKNTDKSEVFTTFTGATGAPMIEECPVNMECQVVQVLEQERHEVFIGRIEASYVEEKIIHDGAADLTKIQPLLFAMNDKGYWSLGPRLADAWRVGKKLKAK